jgi:BBSome-interacting protein 1
MEQQDVIKQLRNLVPKNGVVFNEKIDFPEILCKPKLLPLKSMTLKKLEDLEKNFDDINNQNQQK